MDRLKVRELTRTLEHFTDPVLMKGWVEALGKTVAIDFDGVLHPYTNGWVGSVPADEPPMPGAVDFLIALRERGYRMVVFSSRCNHEPGLVGVQKWLEKWGLDEFFEEITCDKPAAVAYVDDRAVKFSGEWDSVLVGVEELAQGRSHGAAPR
jgi:hypothetical protein